MSFVTETKSSILISWMVWAFFFTAVFVTRLFFSLPDALPGRQLFYIGVGGMLLTILLRFVIWMFRRHKFKWILSGILNLAIIYIVLVFMNSFEFKRHGHGFRHGGAPGTNPEVIHEKKVVEENEENKTLTVAVAKGVSKVRHEWFMIYLMILGIVYTVVALIELNEQKIGQLVLQDKLSNAKLNALRAQLNPHFMFNALNTVSSLMEENTKEAQQVLEGFSFLLRDMIDKSKEQFTTVEEEIVFIEKYTLIEKKRFDEKLEVRFSIERDILPGKIPSMILQPIVENAIKHGVLKKEGKGQVFISGQKKSDRLLLSVSDDGPGMETEKLIGRVGLNNTRERLLHLYNTNASLEIKNLESGGLLVLIDIPFENLMPV